MIKMEEVKYRNEILSLLSIQTSEIERIIYPVLRNRESEFSRDGIASDLSNMINGIRAKLGNAEGSAKSISEKFISSVNKKQREKFLQSLRSSVGVNIENVLIGENLSDLVKAKTVENTSLIKTIPIDYLDKVERVIFSEMTKKKSSKSMIEQIIKIKNISKNRARVIARDQTSKFFANLNEIRQTNLGIREYIWRTADDDRVVGKPGGKFPKGNAAHQNHFKRNGKRFRWDKPPADGHPGEPILCRCIAQAIIPNNIFRL